MTFGLTEGPPPDRFLVSLAALALLSDVAAERPMVCLIDDAQWLDQESLAVLGFVARRLYADPIGMVFSAREHAGDLTPLEGLATRRIAALDPASAHTILDEAVSGPLDPRVSARMIDETGGNPLAMLELLGELSAEQLAGRFPLPRRLPVGRRVDVHFLAQVATLSPEARTVLLVAAACADEKPSTVWRAGALLGVAAAAANHAVQQGIVSLEPRIAFRHPLIRSAVYDGATPEERQRVHDALATVAHRDGDEDQAAWHRAAAVTTPEETIAADLQASAVRAQRRGGYTMQAAFLTRAAELSPDTRDRALRYLAAAHAYLAAGDGPLAEALVGPGDSGTRRRRHARRRATPARSDRGVLLPAQRCPRHPVGGGDQGRAGRRVPGPTDSVRCHAGRDRRPPVHRRHDPRRGGARGAGCRAGPASAAQRQRPASGRFRHSNRPRLRRCGPAAARRGGDDVHRRGGCPRRHPVDDSGMVRRRRRVGRARSSGDVRARPSHRAPPGALGAMRITLAGLSTSQAWAGQMNDAENSYGEAAEISALIGVPPPATTGVLLEVRAWQGRESESRAVASSTADWGRQKGASILEIFALMGLTVLELGLGRYPEALGWGLQIFHDDPPGFGNRVLPEVVEAGVRGGDRAAAEMALTRLTERATAAATPWALGLLARSRALMATDADAEPYYLEAIDQLAETAVRTELARAHLLYGEWLRRRKRRRDARGAAADGL